MSNLLTLAFLFIFGAIFYRFRQRIFTPLRRFEARNAARRAEEFQALFDRYAHYRQTIKLAEEQVEDVAKIETRDEHTGQPINRYVFLGTQYATIGEAEAARMAVVMGKAREFYIDLDRNWLSRRGAREPLAAALADPSKQENVPPRG
jgi:hypothetical protein